MKRAVLVGLFMLVFLFGASFALADFAEGDEITALPATLWLEPFVSDGVVTSRTITVTGGNITVGIAVYNGAETTVIVKIPYQPNGPFRFVGSDNSAGFHGGSPSFQGGYFVWQGTLSCHLPLKPGCLPAGQPEQFQLELELLQEGTFSWEIIVQEQNFLPLVANPVTVIVPPPPSPTAVSIRTFTARSESILERVLGWLGIR